MASGIPASKFMDDVTLSDFRTITTLLQATEPAERRGKAPTGTTLVRVEDQHRISSYKDNLLYLKISNLANLLVRAHEVIAIVATKSFGDQLAVAMHPAPDLGAKSSDHTLSNELLIKENPRRYLKGPADEVKPKKLVAAAFYQTSNVPLSVGTHTGRYFVKQIKDNKRRDDAGIESAEHIAIVAQLLKSNHGATTEDTIDKTYRSLCLYVINASTEKMLGRFKRGQAESGTQPQGRTPRKGRMNFWEFITKTPEEIHAHDPQANNLGTEALSNDLPNKDQRIFIAVFGSLKDTPLSTQEQDTNLPVYDKYGRLRFQKMLRYTLLESYEALVALKKIKARAKTCPDNEADVNTLGRELEQCAINVNNALADLSDIRISFRQYIRNHMRWLAAVFAIHEQKHEEPQEGLPAGLPEAGLASEALTTDLEDLDFTDRPDDEIFELEDLLTTPEQGWPAAVEKYLQLLCLHYDAIQELKKNASSDREPIQRRVTNFVKNVKLETLLVNPGANHQRMTQDQTY